MGYWLYNIFIRSINKNEYIIIGKSEVILYTNTTYVKLSSSRKHLAIFQQYYEKNLVYISFTKGAFLYCSIYC